MGFVGLNTAYTGLVAAQIGIDTASHNVSNTSTEGYTRQRVDQVTRRPMLRPEAFIGSGTEVTDVKRARDEFLDARFRSGAVVLGSLTANAELLERTEAVLGEPDNGLTVALDDVFDAFEDMALAPDDEAARVSTLRTLDRFADRTRGLAEDMRTLEADTVENLQFMVEDTNATIAEIAELNNLIGEAATSGNSPNDLLDQRDRLLDELSRELGVNVIRQGEYDIRVSLGGMAIVDGITANSLTLDTATYDLVHPTGATVTPGGEIGGTQRFLQDDLPDVFTRINSWVDEVVTAFNTQHAAGFSDAATAGGDLFTVLAGSEAETLTSVITDPGELAASDDGAAPFPLFNGINAQAMADLRDQLVASTGTETPGGALRSFITQLGAQVATARRGADAQDELVAAAELTRDASHGVNLDEEMVALVQYQRAYQASARVITTVDQTLDTLINRTGVVGR
ncbi:MAG: flagellar hook-associated protein FlgK [Actinomycetota bacterium]